MHQSFDLGGGVSTCFHFFIAWFSGSSKLTRGGSEGTTSSHLKIRLTTSQMSRGFTFNLSVVAFLRHLVIWTFHISYLGSSCSHFLLLEMLFKVWWGDLERLPQPILHRGLWIVYLHEYQGAGTSLSIFVLVSGNFTGFHTETEWMSPPCPRWWGFKWLVHKGFQLAPFGLKTHQGVFSFGAVLHLSCLVLI